IRIEADSLGEGVRSLSISSDYDRSSRCKFECLTEKAANEMGLIEMLGNQILAGIGGGCDARSFGGLWLCVSGGCLLLLFPEQPALQPVEVDVDNRRRIERENLRQREPADDGVAERLADLRADART